MKKNHSFLLVLIIAIIFRFYNLNWGTPFYFHPDERNIAAAVSGLSFPTQLNPHFFAYGSLPIYAIYFFAYIKNVVSQTAYPNHVPLELAILVSRAYSAIFSSLLIFLLYKIGEKFGNKSTALICVFLAAFCVGFIQYAHFGTFELWLTFFGTLLLYVCITIANQYSYKKIILAGILLGVLASIKISALALIPLPSIAVCLSFGLSKKSIKKILLSKLILLTTCIAVFSITSPFIFFDFTSFLSSMQYEGTVASGNLPVFYTQGFYKTIPMLYQFTNIYPFLLGIPLTIFFLYTIAQNMLNIFHKNTPRTLIVSALALTFFSQAFLFVKWTRYMIPTLPFIILIISFEINKILKIKNRFSFLLAILLLASAPLYSLLFIHTTYFQKDTRIQAQDFLDQHISSRPFVLSESYDLGILPFNKYPVSLLNTYDLDVNPQLAKELDIFLASANYVILPSECVLRTRMADKNRYPVGYMFYKQLLSNKGEFKKIYQTPCTLSCKIIYNFGRIEETAAVFDRPTVYIFKKQ